MLATALFLYGCGAGRRGAVGEDRVYTHRVGPGETLTEIAEEYYGNPARGKVIQTFNDLEDEEVRSGMVIRVPMSGEDIERLKVREKARQPYNQGLALAENGSYLDASQRFQEALTIDPDFVDAHYNLGVTFQKMKSYEKALDRFRQAASLRPNVAEYHFAMGNSYFHLQRFSQAAKAFTNVIALEKNHLKAQYSLAVSYEKLGLSDEARRAWRRYLDMDDSSDWAAEARRRLEMLK